MNAEAFRAVMRRFPTGVTVVTTFAGNAPKGFTANAFSSVSAEPPTVLVCVNRRARSHPLISAAGHFCVNILRREQREIAERFATHAGGDPFDEIPYRFGVTGSPIIEHAFAHLECELAEEHPAGTHTIVLGTVRACGSSDGAPLGYFNAGYRDFGCTIP